MSTFNPVGIFSESYNGAKVNKDSFANMVVRMFPAGAHPLFAMSDYFKPIPGGPVVRSEHGYHVKQFLFATATVNDAGGLAAGDTALVVDSSAGIVPGMLFQVPATREIVRVTAVVSATELTISRAFGRVAAGVIVDNAVLFCTGNAHTEASVRPTPVHSNTTYVPNYTSIFRNAWGISNTAVASATQLAGYNNLSETREECAMYHSLDWERTAVWSQPLAPTGSVQGNARIHATQGVVDAVYQYANGNVTTAGATTTLAQLETALNLAVNNSNSISNGTDRVILTDRTGYKVISDIGRLEGKDKVDMTFGQTSFGLRYNHFRSTFADFRVVEDKVLNGNGQGAGIAIVIDPAVISRGYLGGRDAIQESMNGVKDSKSSGLDAQMGGLLTEMVIATHVPQSCAVINGLTAAAAS
jgi:hypothetical protein